MVGERETGYEGVGCSGDEEGSYGAPRFPPAAYKRGKTRKSSRVREQNNVIKPIEGIGAPGPAGACVGMESPPPFPGSLAALTLFWPFSSAYNGGVGWGGGGVLKRRGVFRCLC